MSRKVHVNPIQSINQCYRYLKESDYYEKCVIEAERSALPPYMRAAAERRAAVAAAVYAGNDDDDSDSSGGLGFCSRKSRARHNQHPVSKAVLA